MAEALSGIKVAIDKLKNSNALVLYKVGPVLVCSPAMPVESITIPPSLNDFPGTNDAEPGVFKSMHGMVRVVDLRVRFGVDSADRKSPGRIIISEVTGGYAGFWVDEIEDVIAFPEKGWSQLPPLVPREVFSRAIIRSEGIRLYANLENLDKFKATGYLRSHIESIKTAEVKCEAKKINENKKEIINQSEFNKEHDDKISLDMPAGKSSIIDSTKPLDIQGAKEAVRRDAKDDKKPNESSASKSPPTVLNKRPEVIKNKPLQSLKKSQHKNSENIHSFVKVRAEDVKKDYKSRNVVTGNDFKKTSTVKNHFPEPGYANSKAVAPVVPVIEESNSDIIWISILVLGFLAASVYFIEFSGLIESGLDSSPGVQSTEESIDLNLNENKYAIEPNKMASYSGDKVDITKTDEEIVIVINDYDKEEEGALVEEVKPVESGADFKENNVVGESVDLTFDAEENSSAVEKEGVDLNDDPVTDMQVEKLVKNTKLDFDFASENSHKYAQDEKLVSEKPVKTFKNVHIVVEGDTLWDISARYVNDPWRYPELARLSKINDPDLIYPGQKVIIIYNTNR